MNILLTGATGFLGSHLLKGLLKAGHIISLTRRSSSNLSRIADVVDGCHVFDIDSTRVDEIFSTTQFDAVIHCATAYGRKEHRAESILDGNLMFPIRLLEAAIVSGCPYFINTDTFFCKQLPERLERNEPLYMPEYTLSKHQFRAWGQLRAIEEKIVFVNLQMEHIYGPDDAPGKFVPWLESQLKSGVPSVALTDGIQLRDFVPVEDVVAVYLQVLADLPKLQGYQSFEVGTGKTTSVRQFVEDMKEQTGAATELCFGEVPKKREEIMFSTASSQSPYIIEKLHHRKA